MGVKIPINGYYQMNWDKAASNDLKAVIARRGLTYGQVVDRLADVGVNMSAHAFNKKINRGGFSHSFFLQCLQILDQRQDSTRPPNSDSQGV